MNMKLVACSFALASVGSIICAAAVEQAMTWSWGLARRQWQATS
jgi:hypothetical protein